MKTSGILVKISYETERNYEIYDKKMLVMIVFLVSLNLKLGTL